MTYSKENFQSMAEKTLIKHLGLITDLDTEIIKACHFDKEQLVDVFAKAVSYHDAIAQAHKELENIDGEQTLKLRDTYGYAYKYTGLIKDSSAVTSQLVAKIISYEQGLSRLSNSITTKALIRNNIS